MAIEPNTAPAPAAQVQTGVWFSVFTVLGLLSIAFAAMFGAAFLEGWGVYATITTKHLKVEALRNLMLAAGAAGAVIAGVLGLALAAVRTHALNRQAKTAEKEANLSEQKHAVETDLAQRRDQSEAFAKAIEQLGHTNFAVRLGAVYALEALAKSSQELHGPIFETLCAYVRNKAPAKKAAVLKPADETAIGGSVHYLLEPIDPPHVVVQAILTVIGRREPKRDPDGFRLDLRNTNLRKADLRGDDQRGGHFERALFENARLEGAILKDALLKGADLTSVHLEGAEPWNAHLEGADLSYARLEGASLWDTYLEGATLTGAQFEGAFLRGVSFNAQTNVDGANFEGARRIPAHFRDTVQGADMAFWPDDDAPDAWARGADEEEEDASD